MPSQRIGAQTVALSNPPSVLSYACVGGKFEGQGPLRDCFDILNEDSFFGEETWEKAESAMQKQALGKAISASTVRAALQAGDWQTLSQLVPQTTLDYFKSSEAEPVLKRIRSAANVIHY